MIKILIADDEATIRRGLEHTVPWKENGCTVVYAAKNGVDVLDFFRKDYADIVICDIKMPRMDGLELLKRLRENHPNLAFIFISGYAEFSYAKEALHYGASAYLLKPIDPQELIGEVNKIIVSQHLNTENVPLKQILERNFNGLEKSWDYTNYEYLRDELESSYFCVVNIRCSYSDMRSHLFFLTFQKRIDTIIQSVLRSQDYASIESSSHGIVYCIMNSDSSALNYFMHQFVTRLSSELKEYYASSFGIWTGGVYQGVNHILDSYVESFSDSCRFISQLRETSSNETLSFDLYENLFSSEDTIIACLMQGETSQAEALLLCQQEAALRSQILSDDIRLYLRHLFFRFHQALKETNQTSGLPDPSEFYSTLSMKNIPEMFQQTCEYLKQIPVNTRPVNTTQTLQNLEAVKNYIQNSYSDPFLSLSSIASNVSLNASYLSTTFSRQEGITLSVYITNLRIEHAKQLLRDTDLRISEISTAVGFINSTYFSTSFRKQTGYSPSEYRKRGITLPRDKT